MRWEYLLVDAGELDAKVSKLGDEGWELVACIEKRAAFKRPLPMGDIPGLVKVCGNCENFQVEKDNDKNALCPKFQTVMNHLGSCGDGFIQKKKKAGPAEVSAPALAPAPEADDMSPWHLQPNTVLGEKRLEAMTELATGVQSAEHRHKLVMIMDKDRKVIAGRTDKVDDHFHPVAFLGSVEEADGHVHNFELP